MLIPYVASCQDNPYTPGLLARAYSLWLAKSKSMNIAHKDSALKLHVSVEANMFQTGSLHVSIACDGQQDAIALWKQSALRQSCPKCLCWPTMTNMFLAGRLVLLRAIIQDLPESERKKRRL